MHVLEELKSVQHSQLGIDSDKFLAIFQHRQKMIDIDVELESCYSKPPYQF
jgi:hypothetical protein